MYVYLTLALDSRFIALIYASLVIVVSNMNTLCKSIREDWITIFKTDFKYIKILTLTIYSKTLSVVVVLLCYLHTVDNKCGK